MTSDSSQEQLFRGPETPARATLLELFFDLVYVAAFNQVSTRLAEHLGWYLAFQTLLVLMALWWVWSVTALVTDFYNPERRSVQIVALGIMSGCLLMAATVRGAFNEQGAIFAAAYVALHLGHGLFFAIALRGHELHGRALRYLFWFSVSGVPWLIGGFSPDPARTALWTLALALDYGIAAIGYPTPRLGRVPAPQYTVTAEHLAERYQQIVIIALGDAILSTILAFGQSGFEASRLAALAAAFVTTVLLWRIYVHRAGQLIPAAIEAASRPDRLVRSAPNTHLVMVAGVVVISASFKLVITHPTAEPNRGWLAVIIGGAALFLAGRARFEYQVFGLVPRSRVIGLLGLAVITPPLLFVPPIFAAIGTGLILAAIATFDVASRGRGRLPEEATPAV